MTMQTTRARPALPAPEARRLRHTLALAFALALAVALTAGCALTPPKPPDCDGPWTPINPPRVQDGS
jgi:hypothetical protein